MLKLENIYLEQNDFKLNDINLDIKQGDYLVILGSSGVGKTFLLESIVGLNKIKSGKIFLNDEEISNKEIHKRNISIVFQGNSLFPHLNVFENISYPLKSKKEKNIKNKVLEVAKKVGIENKLYQKTEILSGGETQRVALARALASNNNLILLDEPLSSLDQKAKNEIKLLLRQLNREGLTFIHVTHDFEEAISLANKIAVIENGKMNYFGDTKYLFNNPKSEFIASFIGYKNYYNGKIEKSINSDLSKFVTQNGFQIFCLTELSEGEAFLLISPNEITVLNQKEETSNRNNFYGKIIDIAKAKIGMELLIDVGIKFYVSVSLEAIESLNLFVGKEVWISFKASACKISR